MFHDIKKIQNELSANRGETTKILSNLEKIEHHNHPLNEHIKKENLKIQVRPKKEKTSKDLE